MDLQPIRSAILSRYPELINSVRGVNKETRDELKTVHLLNKCKLPISKEELFKYLDTIPNKYGFFDLTFIPYVGNNSDYLSLESKIIVVIPPIGNTGTYGIMNSRNNARVTMVRDDFYHNNEGSVEESTNNTSKTTIVEKLKQTSWKYSDIQTMDKHFWTRHNYFIDILSYYNIIKRRIPCYEVDPNYAKNMTKEHFINILKLLYDSNADSIRGQSINLVDTYLNINAYILNIEFPEMLNYNAINDYDQFMTSTKDERQTIIDKIYTVIDNL
jgi:hypothetical protein